VSIPVVLDLLNEAGFQAAVWTDGDRSFQCAGGINRVGVRL